MSISTPALALPGLPPFHSARSLPGPINAVSTHPAPSGHASCIHGSARWPIMSSLCRDCGCDCVLWLCCGCAVAVLCLCGGCAVVML